MTNYEQKIVEIPTNQEDESKLINEFYLEGWDILSIDPTINSWILIRPIKTN